MTPTELQAPAQHPENATTGYRILSRSVQSLPRMGLMTPKLIHSIRHEIPPLLHPTCFPPSLLPIHPHYKTQSPALSSHQRLHNHPSSTDKQCRNSDYREACFWRRSRHPDLDWGYGHSTTIGLLMAYINIKLLQIDQHRAWMIRTWSWVRFFSPLSLLAQPFIANDL